MQALEIEVILTKAFTAALDCPTYRAGVVITGLGCIACPPASVARALLTAFSLRPIVPVQVSPSWLLALDDWNDWTTMAVDEK